MSDPTFQAAYEQLVTALERARGLGLKEPAAVALATTDLDGRPTVRIVLIRGVDERGLTFFTNSRSLKGRQLLVNPRASLCFYWDAVREQIRVDGKVERVTEEESDAYWRQRSRSSQLASAASLQSEKLADTEVYAQAVAELQEKYEGTAIPRPSHWFGYRIVPDSIEFWYGRDARMHERIIYEKGATGWMSRMLYP